MKFYSVQAAADRVGIDISWLRKLMRRHELPAIKVPRAGRARVVLSEDTVDRLRRIVRQHTEMPEVSKT